MQNETSGASPLRADVRLVPAHAPNYRRCFMGKSRLYMRQYCQEVHEKKKKFRNYRKRKHWNQILKKHSEKLRHSEHDDEQHQQAATLQRQDQHHERNTDQRHKYVSGTYKYKLVRYTAVYSTFTILSGPGTLLLNHTGCQKIDKKNRVHQIKKEGQALRGSNLRPHSLAE